MTSPATEPQPDARQRLLRHGLEVSLGLWQDRPPAEAVTTAHLADRYGYPRVWVGEMATYDAFVLATHIGRNFTQAELVIGPLAVTVRDPAMIAIGAASVADLTARPVSVAIGTSSTVVVEHWHGRSRRGSAQALEESAMALRPMLGGERSDLRGEHVRSRGYRLRLAPPSGRLVVAAFGERALRTAVAHADQLVLNLVSPELVAELVGQARKIADELGRPMPSVALWAPAAVGLKGAPGASVDQLRRGLVGYLGAPGYGEMFARAGFADVVDLARGGARPAELLAATPKELVECVGLLGTKKQARTRVERYHAAGADTVVVVPSATEADPAGRTTLRLLAEPT